MYAPLPMGGMENYYQGAEFTAKKVAKETVETAAELIKKKHNPVNIYFSVRWHS
jgi:hypothetical protein